MDITQENGNFEFPIVLVESVYEKKKSFLCTMCNESFGYKHVLARHIESKHEEKKNYKCDVCDKTFSCNFNLKKHIELGHEGNKPFICHICATPFRQKPSLRTHILSVHEGKKFECDICESSFLKRTKLKKHKEKFHEKNVDVENSCNSKNEEENEGIISEIKEKNVDDVGTVHEKKKPFKCSECIESFGYKHVLDRHIKLKHEKRKPYKCNSCNLLITEEYDLKDHIESVHEGRRTYREIFQNSQYTTVYIEREKKLACDDYQNRLENVSVIHGPSATSTKEGYVDFANSPNLQENDIFFREIIKEEADSGYIEYDQTEQNEIKNDPEIEPIGNNNLAVKRIENSVNANSTAFAKTHDKMKPFKCTVCNECFGYKHVLARHIESKHEENNSYKCEVCGKSFGSNYNLKRHLDQD